MKTLKKIGLGLLLLLLVAQFFRPNKNQGETTEVMAFLEETNPPKNVRLILKDACFDCHSNKTEYPWYSNITPINFWLNHHIEEGKDELNFSSWNNYSIKRKEHKMEELYEEVVDKKMPLNSYTWTHAEAKLSQEQIETVVAWGKKTQAIYKQQIPTN